MESVGLPVGPSGRPLRVGAGAIEGRREEGRRRGGDSPEDKLNIDRSEDRRGIASPRTREDDAEGEDGIPSVALIFRDFDFAGQFYRRV